MQVSKEELLHIANLANLNLEESEQDSYLKNLQEILDFAEIINKTNTDSLEVTVGANEAKNIFRKDEVQEFEENSALLQNSKDVEFNMFRVPKVVN